MESKILTKRIEELINELENTCSPSLRIKATKPMSLGDVEEVAVSLNFLPFVLYRESSNEPETGGLDEYFYGKGILAQEYFAAVINSNLEKYNLSQAEISKKTKIAASTISMVLTCNRKPRIATVEKMASALGLIPSYLVPKRTGRPPLQLYKESFEKVVETLQQYLISPTDDVPLADFYQAIEYGTKINELAGALKVRYNILREQGHSNQTITPK